MMINITQKRMLFLLTVIFVSVAACGGGEGGGSASPTKAIVKVGTEGTVTSQINGIEVIVSLPAGVTVKATANPPQTDSNVVTGTGKASSPDLELGTYLPESGTVTVYVFNTTGIAVGEFATVNCDIAAGVSPHTADFGVSSLKASDLDGNIISGLSPTITVSFE